MILDDVWLVMQYYWSHPSLMVTLGLSVAPLTLFLFIKMFRTR